MAVLGIEEIEELLEEIRKRVLLANREGTLDRLLRSMGMHDLIEAQSQLGNKDGRIVVLGGSDVDERILLGIAGGLGIDKSRFEFCLDYEAIQKYNFRKLQYSDKYRLILVGPMPHSTTGMRESASTIAEMEAHQEMYPRIIRLMSGNELKITKNGFREALQEAVAESYI